MELLPGSIVRGLSLPSNKNLDKRPVISKARVAVQYLGWFWPKDAIGVNWR